ncbi:hypothetical protein C6P40_004962 [Pichia californica]|uniref:Prenyltransferase alpha-alpha toroid domain-containing protein n=1 Tax=Pichia californica TaxID=460514 RepID=A0A9P7BH22_9ASCO|nr:hypothetical protein C6P42_005340 [[Candida] californica]KAG0689464.1 hypothetical protein C6P40_004962 [[Candida] californica]
MSNEIPYLDIKKHSRCHKMFLSVLPNKYQSEDSNKLAIAYFSLSSLKLMNTLESTFSESERKGFIEFIYLHLIVFDDISGFRGSFIYLKNDKNSIDIASTCFALQCLLILGDDLKRLNKFKILNFVKILQLSNGGFKNSINSNFENDVRYCMIATTICKILVNNFENFINLKNLQKFIYNLQNFDGGFSMFKGDESHCGMIFCAIDSLSLISSLSSSSSSKLNFNKLIDFLTHRQISFNKFNELELENNEFSDINDIGGFNGRINKYGDTCYVFWVLGSLKLLGFLNLINKNLALNFLLNKTQNKTLGGFNKTTDPDELPDPLHSYLGLCALSLLNHPDLESLNTELVIPQSSYENYLKKRDEII